MLNKLMNSNQTFQRKRSKTPLDEGDEPPPMTYISVTRPVITLDQVKNKVDEIKEGRRHSGTDNSDAKKVELSFVDETLWQAAERTVTPMWEIATTTTSTASTADDGVAQKKSSVTTLKAPNANEFLNHDKVSGKSSTFRHYEQTCNNIFKIWYPR